MGYFSNGTMGMAYEEEYCVRCIHYGEPENGKGCAVWDAHILYSYELCNEPNNPLNVLIPRLDGPPWNDQCRMFVEDKA